MKGTIRILHFKIIINLTVIIFISKTQFRKCLQKFTHPLSSSIRSFGKNNFPFSKNAMLHVTYWAYLGKESFFTEEQRVLADDKS